MAIELNANRAAFVGCAVRTETGLQSEDSRCARRTLQSFHANRSHGHACRSGAALNEPVPVILVRNAG
jgi:hypothetical protein